MAEILYFHRSLSPCRIAHFPGTRTSFACAISTQCPKVRGSPRPATFSTVRRCGSGSRCRVCRISLSTSSAGYIQYRQALRLGLALKDVPDQPCHVVDVDELDLVVEVLLASGKHARESLALFAHFFGSCALAVGRAAECSHQVILDTRSGKNMRPQNIGAASAQGVRARLHHFIRLLLMNGVGQGDR